MADVKRCDHCGKISEGGFAWASLSGVRGHRGTLDLCSLDCLAVFAAEAKEQNDADWEASRLMPA